MFSVLTLGVRFSSHCVGCQHWSLGSLAFTISLAPKCQLGKYNFGSHVLESFYLEWEMNLPTQHPTNELQKSTYRIQVKYKGVLLQLQYFSFHLTSRSINIRCIRILLNLGFSETVRTEIQRKNCPLMVQMKIQKGSNMVLIFFLLM